MKRAAAVLLLPLACSAEEGAGDGMGRLFTTLAQRQAMAERVSAPDARLEGVVRRPGGDSVAWVDGRRLGVGDPLPGGGRLLLIEAQGVVVERAGRRFIARVGERLDGTPAKALAETGRSEMGQ